MKTPKDVLVAAREILATKGWTQGVLARGAAGKPLAPHSPDATCFCVAGAMQLVTYHTADGEPHLYFPAIRVLEKHVGMVDKWNDTPGREKEEVLATLDMVIANCGEKK